MEKLHSDHHLKHLPFLEEKGDGFEPDICWLCGWKTFQMEWIFQQCAACIQGDVCKERK